MKKLTLPFKIIKKVNLESLKETLELKEKAIVNATSFIKEIENGNLEVAIDKTDQDDLSLSIIKMRDQMKKISLVEKERNWVTEGLAKFVEILRANNDNLKQLADDIILNLVKYLNASQGALFIINDESSEQYLELTACYAYNRKKFLEKRINLGEGLVGQTYLEKETIYLKEIPENYITITSGLGESLPKNILLVPLKINEDVYGVVEIACFHTLLPYQVSFIERLGESIASTISSVRVNQKTKILLQESQSQTEELKSQEEEVRQNMEELSATQEEMTRVSAEMEGQLSAINKTMATIEFDLTGKVLVANENFLKLLEYSLVEIEGKHHRIFVDSDESKSEEYSNFWKNLSQGKSELGEFRRITKTGKEIFIKGVYTSIFDIAGNPKKILKIAYDITASKEMEFQIKEQLEMSQAQEEEMRQNMEELSATQEEMERILKEVQSNEAFMNDLMNATNDSILTIDKAYRVISCNKATLATFNVPELTKGFDLLSFFTGEEKQKYKALYDRVLGGEYVEVVDKFEHGGKQQFIGSNYSPIRNDTHEIIGVACFSRDITESVAAKNEIEDLLDKAKNQAEELKAQEEELRQNMEELSATQEEMERMLKEVQETEQFLYEVLNVCNDSIVTLDKNYRVMSFNKAFEKSFKEKNIAVGKGFCIMDIFPKDVQKEKKKLYDRVLNGETIDIIDHLNNAGFNNYFQVQHSPLRNPEGKIIAVSIYAKDITETVKLQKELAEHKK